ncbi:restriction endonuclease subunit S [Aerococcaceae bacterium DSM 111020]|nr:restriction endonuclease subunit S [Aerococcaceae bacterium DSM 111020]
MSTHHLSNCNNWKQHKVSEFAVIHSGKDYKHLESGDIPVYGTGGYMLSVNESLSDNDAVGIGRKGTIDVPQLLKAPFWTVDTLFYVTPKYFEVKFLFFVFQKINWKKYDESTGVPSLSKRSIEKIKIFLPSNLESQKISQLLFKIDNLITLEQEKLSNLVVIKQYLSTILFAFKEKPVLRFKSFNEDWQPKKLKDVGEISTGNTPSTKDSDNYTSAGVLWITPSDINSLIVETSQKQLSEKGIKKARIAKKGSILVTCIASIGKNALISEDSAFNQQINAITPNNNYDSYFLLTQSFHWSELMKRIASAGTMDIINKSEFSNLISLFPQLNEQKKIGIFFKKIDRLIELQNNSINLFEMVKQTLLKNLLL